MSHWKWFVCQRVGFRVTSLATTAGVGLVLFTISAEAVGCNSGDVPKTALLTSGLCQAEASSLGATAIGQSAKAGDFSVGVGAAARVSGANATAIGTASGSNGSVEGITTVGANTASPTSPGFYSTAIGAGPSTSNAAAYAFGAWTIAIGGGDNTDRPGARADGIFSVAIGNSSVATGEGYALGVGFNAHADVGLAPTAVGTDSTARGTNAAAFGRFSAALRESSTALGAGAVASRKNSVALGFGSIADKSNVVSVGTPNGRRRIINVASAVDPTDAVNLRQVQQLIATAAAKIKPKNAALEPVPGSYRLASLGSIATLRSGQRTTPASVTCEFSGGKVTTAADEQASGSPTFSPIAQSAISFIQSGSESGCVTLSFSAEGIAPGASIMEVRAIMDGYIDASPGPVLLSQDDDTFRSRAFNFLFPEVPPGAHRVEVQFRNAGEQGFVRVGQRTTMVQFAK